ncbi:hypothetical protein MUK42_21132 [Musa troglodytarum]|nr:hypothetical protein MUK42_21132 [Musa troglodytarum]
MQRSGARRTRGRRGRPPGSTPATAASVTGAASGCRRSASRARPAASGSARTPPPRWRRWPTTSRRARCVAPTPC